MSVKIADPVLVEIVAETLDAIVKDIHSPTLDSESVKNILTTASVRLRKAITETASFEDTLNYHMEKMTAFLEKNPSLLLNPITDHSSISSSLEQIHAGGDEEKEATAQLNRLRKLN